ncbi:hypothetical protein ACQEVG_26505 [Streptomyces sp. CA-135486]|uniref:hypothetical protein n=1 Tax=Streptomyces sp. CA-135486 TaxID=3240049 RepID=UPI003D91BBD4
MKKLLATVAVSAAVVLVAPTYAAADAVDTTQVQAANCVNHPWGHLKLGGYNHVACWDLSQHGDYVRAWVKCSRAKTSPSSAWVTRWGPYVKEQTASFAYCDDNEYLQDWGYKYKR